MILQVLAILNNEESSNRLTQSEIDSLANFTYELHDHTASRPARSLFWYRIPEANFRVN